MQKECDGELNHAALLVGYGTSDAGTKYCLVQNSFGESWGDDGYFKVEKDGEKDTCKIETRASQPTVAAQEMAA